MSIPLAGSPELERLSPSFLVKIRLSALHRRVYLKILNGMERALLSETWAHNRGFMQYLVIIRVKGVLSENSGGR